MRPWKIPDLKTKWPNQSGDFRLSRTRNWSTISLGFRGYKYARCPTLVFRSIDDSFSKANQSSIKWSQNSCVWRRWYWIGVLVSLSINTSYSKSVFIVKKSKYSKTSIFSPVVQLSKLFVKIGDKIGNYQILSHVCAMFCSTILI